MNRRPLKQAWWQGRVAHGLSATALATVLLAATAASVAAMPPPEPRHPGAGRRAFNAGNACGDAQGSIEWQYGRVTINPRLRDFGNARSQTHLYLSWQDEKGKHNEEVATISGEKGGDIDVGEVPYQTSGMPHKALATVCSNNCKGGWKCGRPG